MQRPRPPLTIGGRSPTVLRIAAARSDCWNTHGPFGRSVDEILEITRDQNARLDQLCRERGREPTDVRRSLLLCDALDAWATPDAFEETVSSFRDIGISGFVVFWPTESQSELFRRAAHETIPALRAAGVDHADVGR